ncbi:PspC domain-containing protein [Gordonia sp. VNQ95]|uniref:PspC domain-containing protein n=1 Tax=Gordonia TaxID=2053 RepID=UPI0032B350BD
MDTAQFRTQVSRLWDTRPVRPAAPRTVAGVCIGIGNRYRVDPTLVKVAFVVATVFGGSGLILYIAAWIAFPSSTAAPAPGGDPAANRRARHGNPSMILLVVVVVIIATSIGSSGPWGSGGLLGGILMLVGWWLLYLRTPEPLPETAVSTLRGPSTPQRFERWTPRAVRVAAGIDAGSPPPRTESTAAAVDLTKVHPEVHPDDTATIPASASAADFADRTPPAWDPLGAARFAWDLPEPAAPAPPPASTPPRRSPMALIVIGLAVLVAAAGAAAHQAGADWFTVPHVLSLVLAVVGAGALVMGLRRHRPGSHPGALVPLTIGLGVAVVFSTVLTTWGPDDRHWGMPTGGVGERNWAPPSENDIRDTYSLGMGKMTLDLRGIDLTTDRRVELRNGVGEVNVEVAEGMNIRATCSTGVGDYTCPEGLDGGADGTDGPVLTIDAHTNVGNVEIRR